MMFKIIGSLLLFVHLHNAQSPKKNNSKVIIAFRHGHANMPCQHTPPPHSKFNLTLLKGEERHPVCVAYTNGMDTKLYNWVDQAPCYIRKTNESAIALTIFNLSVSHTDSYSCRLQNFSPAPYLDITTNETYVYIHDSLPQECSAGSVTQYFIWIFAGLTTLTFLCLVGILYLFIQRKHCSKCVKTHAQPNIEQNNEYMPMASVNAARGRV
ncbi:inducible T-cell costimulator [Pelobates cultripes]|uniref:Inducible T-cell costimulator n=2 Tax=Pelobates cultripes TaxID=61616 RepID=A0AAD1SQX2_PELCU|nr:inducible T-cell costimulator [Pelobates cultripes]